MEEYGLDFEDKANFTDCMSSVIEYYKESGNNEKNFSDLVDTKRAKYSRSKEKDGVDTCYK